MKVLDKHALFGLRFCQPYEFLYFMLAFPRDLHQSISELPADDHKTAHVVSTENDLDIPPFRIL